MDVAGNILEIGPHILRINFMDVAGYTKCTQKTLPEPPTEPGCTQFYIKTLASVRKSQIEGS